MERVPLPCVELPALRFLEDAKRTQRLFTGVVSGIPHTCVGVLSVVGGEVYLTYSGNPLNVMALGLMETEEIINLEQLSRQSAGCCM